MASTEKHSRKPKQVVIDLTANVDETVAAISEAPEPTSADIDAQMADEQAHEPEIAADAAKTSYSVPTSPPSSNSSGGFFGKLGAGALGGLIALTGAAGLQYAGLLPSLGGSGELAALKAQVDRLASAPAALDPSVVVALGDTQKELADKIEALASSSASTDVSELGQKVTALEAALANGASTTTPDPSQNAAFKSLADKVAALETRPAQNDVSAAVAVAIAASGLKAAIDRGGPFANELETYASVAAASPDIESLRSLAAAGVPSRQELVNDFAAAADAMLAASRAPDANAGILDRLTESAKNLVRARPVGDIPGDAPEALIARMELALGRGDLNAVLAESAKLPDASKVAGSGFLDRVKSRRDADDLVTRALSLALTAAGGKS